MTDRPTHRGAPTLWKPERDAELCDLIADGTSLSAASRIMGITRGAAIGRFQRIAAHLGDQAR